MVRSRAPWTEVGPVKGAVAWALYAATRMSTPVAVATTVAALVVTAALDNSIGNVWSLGLLYYFPVAFAAWRLGRNVALFAGFVSTALWLLLVSKGTTPDLQSLPLWWSFAAHLLTFSFVAVVVSEMRDLFERERKLARQCHLTGALSGRAFRDVLDREVAAARKRGAPMALVYVDMDNFKALNDRFGHAAGDAALEAFSRGVVSVLRKGDHFARTGGDEFVVLLTGAASDRRETVDLIRAAAYNAMQGLEMPVTCSMGAILVPGDRVIDAGDLVRRADKAMYEAKRAGKDGICIFEIGKRSPLSVAA